MFNLLLERWVPISGPSGVADRSVHEVLSNAHTLGGLASLPATINVAVFRQVLLPLVLDVFGPPRSEEELAARLDLGCFDTVRLGAYLDEWSHRFELFDPAAPFAQVADLATANGEVKGVALLQPAAATGNNVPLFSARSEADTLRLTSAEAARWLLHAQCWDTAAIKSGAVGDDNVKGGKTTGNPTSSVGRFGVVMPIGRNLYETLVLNMPVRRDDVQADDRPQWKREPPTAAWKSREARGILDLLTWQSRRIRLVRDDDGMVDGVVLCAGDRLDPFPYFEPHCTWNVDKRPKPGQPERRPRSHQSGSSSWQGFRSIVALEAAEPGRPDPATSVLLDQVGTLWSDRLVADDYPFNVELVGVEYGNQSAVVENVVADIMPLPVAALRADSEVGPMLIQVARDADNLVALVNRLEGDLRRSLGGDLVPWDQGQRASVQLVHRLDGIFRRMLDRARTGSTLADEVLAAWRQPARLVVEQVAEDLLSAVPTVAHQGRLDDGGHRHNVAVAQLRFFRNLNKIVPAAAPADTNDGLAANDGYVEIDDHSEEVPV